MGDIRVFREKPGARPREFFKRLTASLAFASCLLAALLFFAPALHAAGGEVNLLAIGDWGADTPAQKRVAVALKRYVERQHIEPDAVLLLGDNFYVSLEGVDDPQWKKLFESMYDARSLAVPFYAVLGNHDHENHKEQIELDYAKRNPDSRFKLPDYWYRVDLPQTEPLVTLIALDSNPAELGEERWAAQNGWLEAELSRPRPSRWTICFAHHPLFSDSQHGDDANLQETWGPLFKKYDVAFYLAGHDHALEHLQIPAWPTSFLVSGGGGNETYGIKRNDRATFARGVYGFVHLQIDAGRALVRFVGDDGKTLYVFERTHEGLVRALPDRSAAAATTP